MSKLTKGLIIAGAIATGIGLKAIIVYRLLGIKFNDGLSQQ